MGSKLRTQSRLESTHICNICGGNGCNSRPELINLAEKVGARTVISANPPQTLVLLLQNSCLTLDQHCSTDRERHQALASKVLVALAEQLAFRND